MDYFEVSGVTRRSVNSVSGYAEYETLYVGFEDDPRVNPRRNLDTIPSLVLQLDAAEKARVRRLVSDWAASTLLKQVHGRPARKRPRAESAAEGGPKNDDDDDDDDESEAVDLAVEICEPLQRRVRGECLPVRHSDRGGVSGRVPIDTVILGEEPLPLLPSKSPRLFEQTSFAEPDAADKAWRASSHQSALLELCASESRVLPMRPLIEDAFFGGGGSPLGNGAEDDFSVKVLSIVPLSKEVMLRREQIQRANDQDSASGDDSEGGTVDHAAVANTLGDSMGVQYVVVSEPRLTQTPGVGAPRRPASRACNMMTLAEFRKFHPQQLLDYLLEHSAIFTS